jgi:hypothetical protein
MDAEKQGRDFIRVPVSDYSDYVVIVLSTCFFAGFLVIIRYPLWGNGVYEGQTVWRSNPGRVVPARISGK